MSDEMAVGDNASQEEHKVIGEETEADGHDTANPLKPVTEVSAPYTEAKPEPNEDQDQPEPTEEIAETEEPVKEECEAKEEQKEDITKMEPSNSDDEITRGINRRASVAFSDSGDEEFKGFDSNEKSDLADYGRIVERLEAEVSAAVKSYTPLRSVMASPALRASKRARQDTGGCTKWSEHLEAEVSAFVRSFSEEEVKPAKRQRQGTDGSRPSSALSSRSDGDGAISTDASASPAARGRRATVEMSSPQLRVPLERGWRRELVYRAAGATADAAGRRNADIYYYTPAGKKLRSTREVSEHLSGTGLTLENFSFFKESLGIDDPEKEIIRDAKVMHARRVESPVPAAPAPVLDGKRTPKPKAPKGASPEPATPKSPPAKLKVKSMGSRLSSNGTATPKPAKKPPPPAPAPAPAPPAAPAAPAAPADNNNTAAWKKPKGQPPPPPRAHPPHPQHPQHPHAPAAPHPQQPQNPPAEREKGAHRRQSQQPCSMSCGRGAVPSLACAACLCLYHPACVGVAGAAPDRFLCKNCRKPGSPPPEPPAAPARRAPAPAKVPKPNDKRVLLRMKVAGGGPDGERVWAVSSPGAAAPRPALPRPAPPRPALPRPALPQSLAVLNGRRFIVVTRALHQ